MGTKLCQLLAVETGAKAKVGRRWTDAYHLLQKPALLSGISRTYAPIDEEGDQFPPESTLVQVDAEQVVKDVGSDLRRLYDLVVTKDNTNCSAKADVVVDEVTVLSGVPVTSLLYLERQLTDIHTFVSKLPVLDPSDKWQRDGNAGCYVTDPIQTLRSKKITRPLTLAPATDKHPAQVQLIQEDVVAGTWTTRKFSGALPADRRAQLVDRVEKLQNAVKMARESANSIEVADVAAGDPIFDYLLAP